jgi:hypothetical protein
MGKDLPIELGGLRYFQKQLKQQLIKVKKVLRMKGLVYWQCTEDPLELKMLELQSAKISAYYFNHKQKKAT